MKKVKPNRAKQKNRKFIKGTAAYYRRKYTQFMQRESRKDGAVFHPRSLARSVGRVIGCLGAGVTPSRAAANFRLYADAAIKVPLQGTDYRSRRVLNRKVRKLERGAEG